MRPNAHGETSKLLGSDELLQAHNFELWRIKLKDLCLSQKCWGFVTGIRSGILRNMRLTGRVSEEKYHMLTSEGNELALGVMRRSMSDSYIQMVDDCNDARQAFNILKDYFAALTVNDSSVLHRQFTDLKMNMEEGAERYVADFNRLRTLLSSADMEISELLAVNSFLDNVSPELQTTCQILRAQGNTTLAEVQRRIVGAHHDWKRARSVSAPIARPADVRLPTIEVGSSSTALLVQALAAMMNPRGARKRPRTAPAYDGNLSCTGPRGCGGRGHEYANCFGNPESTFFRPQWRPRRQNRGVGDRNDGSSAPEGDIRAFMAALGIVPNRAFMAALGILPNRDATQELEAMNSNIPHRNQ